MTDDWGNLNFFEDNFICSECDSSDVVPAIGSKKSNILIVAEFPGKEEIKSGKPMIGNMGTVLRVELSKLGLDLKQVRRMNLWQHPKNKNEKCLQIGMEEVIKEAERKEYILLLGDDVVKCFLDRAVTKVSGLQMKSSYFSALCVPCSNPASLFQKGNGVGEVRLALKKFVGSIKELEDKKGWM